MEGHDSNTTKHYMSESDARTVVNWVPDEQSKKPGEIYRLAANINHLSEAIDRVAAVTSSARTNYATPEPGEDVREEPGSEFERLNNALEEQIRILLRLTDQIVL